jgi:hypothetical protein
VKHSIYSSPRFGGCAHIRFRYAPVNVVNAQRSCEILFIDREQDMNIFSNPWVVGIGGGIISGILVTVVTRYLFSKREKREYLQRVETANNEVLYSIRPSIAEKVFPSLDVIDSVLVSTAKKYGLEKNDLYTVVTISNDVIKEIMANPFLSSQQKVEFCELVSNLRKQYLGIREAEVHKPETIKVVKESSSEFISLTLGVMTGATAIVATLVTIMKGRFALEGESTLRTMLPIILVATFIPLVLSVTMVMIRRMRRIAEGKVGKKVELDTGTKTEPGQKHQ